MNFQGSILKVSAFSKNTALLFTLTWFFSIQALSFYLILTEDQPLLCLKSTYFGIYSSFDADDIFLGGETGQFFFDDSEFRLNFLKVFPITKETD